MVTVRCIFNTPESLLWEISETVWDNTGKTAFMCIFASISSAGARIMGKMISTAEEEYLYGCYASFTMYVSLVLVK